MAWDGMERRKDGSGALLAELEEMKRTIVHHINSDETKFTLIIDQLHTLDTSIAKMIVLSEQTLKNQLSLIAEAQKSIIEHNKFLYDPKDGISIRIDRLEGVEGDRKWNFRVIWAAIITLLLKVSYDFVKGH